MDDPLAKLDNLTAALSLRGEPTSDAEREASFGNVEWRTDPDAQRAVIDHALGWCQVPGGQHYVSAGMTQFKVDPDQRRALLEPSIGASPWAALICTNGREDCRRVEFDTDGRVLFQHGGTQVPTGWPVLAAEMTVILTELAPTADYGLVRRIDQLQILWQDLFLGDWPKLTHLIPASHLYTRRFETTHVPDPLGVQLLGPGHADRLPTGPDWAITPTAGQSYIVTHANPDAWYANPTPDPDILEHARRDFAPLLITYDLAETERLRRAAAHEQRT